MTITQIHSIPKTSEAVTFHGNNLLYAKASGNLFYFDLVTLKTKWRLDSLIEKSKHTPYLACSHFQSSLLITLNDNSFLIDQEGKKQMEFQGEGFGLSYRQFEEIFVGQFHYENSQSSIGLFNFKTKKFKEYPICSNPSSISFLEPHIYSTQNVNIITVYNCLENKKLWEFDVSELGRFINFEGEEKSGVIVGFSIPYEDKLLLNVLSSHLVAINASGVLWKLKNKNHNSANNISIVDEIVSLVGEVSYLEIELNTGEVIKEKQVEDLFSKNSIQHISKHFIHKNTIILLHGHRESQLVWIDRNTFDIIQKIPLNQTVKARGFSLHQDYIACAGNKKLQLFRIN